MKDKKKLIVFLVAATLIGGGAIKGCVNKSVNRAEKRAEKRALENFQDYILENANGEVLRGMDTTARFNEYANYDDRKLDLWIDMYKDDSTMYANALKRDARLIYDKELGDEKSLEKIHNAPVYNRGPGTEYDADGNAVYNSNSIKGVSSLHNMEVNYDNYKDRVRELYKLRNEMTRRYHR